jgi:hypothetical protein
MPEVYVEYVDFPQIYAIINKNSYILECQCIYFLEPNGIVTQIRYYDTVQHKESEISNILQYWNNKELKDNICPNNIKFFNHKWNY